MKINCDICFKLFKKPGALLFSPPFGRAVVKTHICEDCYEAKFRRYAMSDYKVKYKKFKLKETTK